MLIISKFHDYYDTVRSLGIDKTVVYDRTEIKSELQGVRFPSPNTLVWKHKTTPRSVTFEVRKYVIGFCGGLYPMMVFESQHDGARPDAPKTRFCFYAAEDVQAFTDAGNVKKTSWTSRRAMDYFFANDDRSVSRFFDVSTWDFLFNTFYDCKVPVFVVGLSEERPHKTTLTLSPKLKDFQFFKVKDSFTAFQDIFMFISGVLGISAPVMVEVSDKIKAAKKGHGGKYSFRKPPGEKKRGKKPKKKGR